ncbi:MAG TPA: STAS domain-containing protein [Terriglobales bacterium]|nr:STAS domain-containing protein [Terriglobales bacterium]
MSRSADATILTCIGRLVAGEEASSLEAIAVAQQGPQLLLDLSGADAIDARGLGVLNAIRQWAASRGIEFAVLNPSDVVRSMMALVKLDVNIAVVDEARAVAC